MSRSGLQHSLNFHSTDPWDPCGPGCARREPEMAVGIFLQRRRLLSQDFHASRARYFRGAARAPQVTLPQADIAPVLRESGLPANLFANGAHRIAYSQLERLFLACERKSGCDFVGMLVGQHTRLADLGLAGRVELCEPTAGSGLRSLRARGHQAFPVRRHHDRAQHLVRPCAPLSSTRAVGNGLKSWPIFLPRSGGSSANARSWMHSR